MTAKRMTGEYKGRYGIKTPEGFMPAYEMAAGDKTAETIAAFQAGIDHLADYEDLGVMPEQIREIDALYSKLAKEAAGYKEKSRLGAEALEMRNAKSPYPDENVIACANCGSGEYLYNEDGNENRFCGLCGQAIDWSEDGRYDE